MIAIRDRDHRRDITSLVDLVDTFGSTKGKPKYLPLFTKCASFLDDTSTRLPWSYDVVAGYYTNKTAQLANRILASSDLVAPGHAVAVTDMIQELRVAHGIIKRDFFYYLIPDRLAQAGIRLSLQERTHLKKIASSYYYSAVSDTLGLSPVYGQQHRTTLRLRTGAPHRAKPHDEVVTLPTKLSSEHLVQGLAELGTADIEHLRGIASKYRFCFANFKSNPSHLSLFALSEAMADLNNQIDDAIIAKHPDWELEPTPDSLRSLRTRLERGSIATEFAVELGAFLSNVAVPFLGLVVDLIFRNVKGRVAGDERLVESASARRSASLHLLENRFIEQGSAQKLKLTTDIASSTSSVEILDLTTIAV